MKYELPKKKGKKVNFKKVAYFSHDNIKFQRA
jgi:hypothetical protein